MCIAILNKEGIIQKKTLRNCWKKNRDGAGLSFFNQAGNCVIFKEMTSFDHFFKKYEYYKRRNPDVPFIIHFRIKTSGNTDAFNCHPFQVNREVSFCHNGILSGYSPGQGADHSDTREFMMKVLRPLKPSFTEKEKFILEKIIGTWNKLVLIGSNGRSQIVNESQGEWFEGNWYSNSGYKDSYYSRVTTQSKLGSNYGSRNPDCEGTMHTNNPRIGLRQTPVAGPVRNVQKPPDPRDIGKPGCLTQPMLEEKKTEAIEEEHDEDPWMEEIDDFLIADRASKFKAGKLTEEEEDHVIQMIVNNMREFQAEDKDIDDHIFTEFGVANASAKY